MLDGKEAMPENGTCPEPDEELVPLSRNQPKRKKNRNKNKPKKPNQNRKCNLQNFQNNL